jgi:hypothetical protein
MLDRILKKELLIKFYVYITLLSDDNGCQVYIHSQAILVL